MDNYNYRATVSLTFQQHYDMLIFLIHQRQQVFFVLIWERHNVMFTNIFFPAGNPAGAESLRSPDVERNLNSTRVGPESG